MPFPFAFKRRVARVSIFISAVLGLLFIVTLIVGALAYPDDKEGIIGVALICPPFVSIFAHNILRFRLRTWKYCGRLTELLVSSVELLWLLGVAILFSLPSDGDNVWINWDLLTFVAATALGLAVIQVASILGSFLDIVYLGKKSLREPYNISRGPLDGDEAQQIAIFGAPTWAKR
ncbi:hypothetical protein NP233_g10106 [Leucocoprinus birnbaumii]|uniref:Transmembrane protein n=1 Tax=Leucocoprinus birnbaumii TaxID=56174 RepID=A0AAD5YS82_9AGAR|nr:hypothetical protein NP233_g10106 [Leucocoprinus birnbaumii]